MSAGTATGRPTLHTLADLRAVLTAPIPQRHTVFVRENRGFFYWDPTSSESDNSDNVIRPNDRSSSGGRWVRPTGSLVAAYEGYGSVLGASMLQYSDTDVGVTTVGAGVSAWLDRVNSGNSYAQGDSNRYPTYSATGGPNNAPFIQFVSAGTADVLVSTLTRPAPGTEGTFIRALIRLDTWTVNGTLWSSNSTANVMMCQAFNASPIIRQFNTTGRNENNGLTGTGVWKILNAWFNNAAADELVIGSVTVSDALSAGNSSGTGRILGATLPNGTNPSDYSICKIVYANAKPSPAQITALNAIDVARYGASIIT